MLLSWLDRLTLFVHPQRLLLERRPWRGPATRQQAAVAAPTAGDADWQAALAAAQTLLGASERRGATLRIIIADHFVRYAVLPWSDALPGPRARHAMALALLRNALGDRADVLEIAVDRPAFGRSGIAAGVDKDLLAGLRAAARKQRLRLISQQPRLLAEFSGRHQGLGDGWFAAIDSGWLTLAGLRNGQIVCLHNHRAGTDNAVTLGGELTGLLAAESAVVNDRKLFICRREIGQVAPPRLAPEWQTISWPAICTAAQENTEAYDA